MAALLAALALLLVPTWVRLWGSLWNEEAYEYGAIMVAICLWLAWRLKDAIAALPVRPARAAGSAALAIGLLMYYIGRSQQQPVFEAASHLPIVTGLLLVVWGWAAVRKAWFALLFLAFTIPLPGFVLVAMTSHLKEWVSVLAEALLYHAGYPIARDGVVITIGQYPMLVADACSGLNSIYSLTAVGLLYLHLTYRRGLLRNSLLLLAVLPMAFLANLIRVIALMLLTYHLGYDAGQGFMHGASGMLLFVVALVGLLAFDALMRRFEAVPAGAAA